MQLLLTGATGFIGGGVARAAVTAGHQVTALVRSASTDAAARLADLGVHLREGDLADTPLLAELAGSAAGVVHTASSNDEHAESLDENLVTATLSAMAPGSGFVYTSGAWVYGDTGELPVTEDAELHPTRLVAWRPAMERRALALAAQRSVAAVVLRPAMVHGHGGGVFAMLAQMGRHSGAVRIVGEGRNRWPTVHVDDLAVAYLRALDAAVARKPDVDGQILNVVAEQAVSVAEMAEAIRRAIGAEAVTPWPIRDARQDLGPFADALALDQCVDGDRAKHALGWAPRQPDVITDLAAAIAAAAY
ncbi:NAD-dependent epimerase/dehydratase family protein [Mycolicibacterium palauense]|uniref:NAD-dependent epimerase/dehydratase family protein n=1 Tax=Mycolicibacterium palauense TaxID=2034511 RepID=UPI000BFEC4E8|nr:NAD-dependent epimerase/dehydratase family protein [Mycolicibacterium palauense]